MKKRCVGFLICLGLFGMVIACGLDNSTTIPTSAAEEPVPGFLERVRGHQTSSGGKFTEYRDIETGVHYFVYTDEFHVYQHGGGLGASMCPRYNADGSLYVD